MDHSIFDFRFHCAVVLTGLMLLPAALLPAASAQADDSKAKAIGIAAAVEALPAGVRPPGRYALVIGADAYNDTRIPGLPACGNDARTLAAVLTDPQTGMVPKENLRLLVGESVTRENVIDALDNLGRKAGRDDLVIVFFSGHGATDEQGRAYWVMSGTKADKLRSTALPETDVSGLLGGIHATRLVTFIDACYSAATANVAQTKSLLDLSKLYPDFKGDGRVAITASKGDQLSMVISRKEDPGFGYSAFAWHLIEGLKGKADTQGLTAHTGDSSTADGVVTVDELWAYVKDRTERTSRGMGGNQQPQIKGQLGSRFLLTVNSSRMLEIERDREARTNKTAERLAALRKLAIDERISLAQFAQGKSLLEARLTDLNVTQQKQRNVYEDLADGRIIARYLTAVLDAVETPEQRTTRERSEKIASLLAKATMMASNDRGPEALAVLVELLKIDPQNTEGFALQIKIEDTVQQDGIIWGPIFGIDIDPFVRINAARKMPGYKTDGEFVDVFSTIPDKLTPLISTDIYSSIVQNKILESLAQRNPKTLQWEPLVARWWRISEDGLNVEFELRGNVTFSDGEPLTVDDIVFSFEWMMNPQVESPRQKAYYSKIESVTKISETRVRFKFNKPYFQSFELAAGMEIMPKHFYSKYTPEQFNRSTGLLMGSGPYRLAHPESWRPEPGKPVEVLRNDRYWGPPAPFNRITWRVIGSDSYITAFRNGEIDKIYPTPEQFIAMKEDKDLVKRTQNFEYQSPTSGYLYIGWAQQNEGKPTIYADARVRRAMTMLTDRLKICNEIFYGYAIPISGPFNPLSPQSDQSIRPWPYDANEARKLLAEAGFKDTDNDGLLNAPGGKPLVVKISYPNGSETYNRVIQLMKDNFAKAGVVLQEDPLGWNVLLERMTNRKLDAYMLGWSGSIEGDPYQIFHSSMIKDSGDNTISYSNPKLDKLLEQARTTVDEATRMKLWHQVHAIMHEDQPYTFLMTRKSTVFASGRLKNIQVVKNGLSPEIEWFKAAND